MNSPSRWAANGSVRICGRILHLSTRPDIERYALPGQVVVGTDSHTPHSGSLGCLAFGAGSTDIANSWVTGLIRCRVPETNRVELAGALADDVTARDVVAWLLQTELVRSGGAIGAVFEFAGPVVAAVRDPRCARLLQRARIFGNVRSGRRQDGAAGMRRVRELRAGAIDGGFPGDGSSINRNFPGRSGPGSVWLASPYTVAASAICGRLASFGELKALVASGRLR